MTSKTKQLGDKHHIFTTINIPFRRLKERVTESKGRCESKLDYEYIKIVEAMLLRLNVLMGQWDKADKKRYSHGRIPKIEKNANREFT